MTGLLGAIQFLTRLDRLGLQHVPMGVEALQMIPEGVELFNDAMAAWRAGRSLHRSG